MLSDVCLIYSLHFLLCFWEQRVGGKVFYWAALRMQKIAADKVNIMECDPESTSVTIKFFQNLTQYIITHWPWNFEKNLWSGSVYIKLSRFFSKFHGQCVIMYWVRFWKSLYKIIYQGVQENIVILNVIIFCVQTKAFSEFSVTPFLGNKGKTKLARSQNMCTTLIQTLL